jgi:cytochrome c biogenesis protein CcdA
VPQSAANGCVATPEKGDHQVLRLIGLAISIGLADSINPSTVAPALYLATGDQPRRTVAQFTLAVFAVTLAGGLVIALGPGELALALLPHPGPNVRYIIELVAGGAMLFASALLWRYRRQLAERATPSVDPSGRSSWVLGATITLLELPTAFPYFAVIAAVVGADTAIPNQVVLLALYDLFFIAPLLGILVTLELAGENTARLLARVRTLLEREWPTVLAVVAFVAGLIVLLLGATGITGHRGVVKRLRP